MSQGSQGSKLCLQCVCTDSGRPEEGHDWEELDLNVVVRRSKEERSRGYIP